MPLLIHIYVCACISFSTYAHMCTCLHAYVHAGQKDELDFLELELQVFV